jgi:hypothetical protein
MSDSPLSCLITKVGLKPCGPVVKAHLVTILDKYLSAENDFIKHYAMQHAAATLLETTFSAEIAAEIGEELPFLDYVDIATAVCFSINVHERDALLETTLVGALAAARTLQRISPSRPVSRCSNTGSIKQSVVNQWQESITHDTPPSPVGPVPVQPQVITEQRNETTARPKRTTRRICKACSRADCVCETKKAVPKNVKRGVPQTKLQTPKAERTIIRSPSSASSKASTSSTNTIAEPLPTFTVAKLLNPVMWLEDVRRRTGQIDNVRFVLWRGALRDYFISTTLSTQKRAEVEAIVLFAEGWLLNAPMTPTPAYIEFGVAIVDRLVVLQARLSASTQKSFAAADTLQATILSNDAPARYKAAMATFAAALVAETQGRDRRRQPTSRRRQDRAQQRPFSEQRGRPQERPAQQRPAQQREQREAQ